MLKSITAVPYFLIPQNNSICSISDLSFQISAFSQLLMLSELCYSSACADGDFGSQEERIKDRGKDCLC